MGKITIAHGSGGKLTHELIENTFFQYFGNDVLNRADDAAVFSANRGDIAFTTDSFVVKPLFFPGGDIGKLSVCGTVNDLVVCGAEPRYISCGFIIEEGFDKSDLVKVIMSMAYWANEAGVKVVTGDTKVVGRGAADRLFINTSGIGLFKSDLRLGVGKINEGDKVIITGTIGEHGIAVLSKREGLEFESRIMSDCAPLNKMLMNVLDETGGIKFMRDPTRGGLATTLNEIVICGNFGILLEEEKIPISDSVRAACALLGLDPLYIANEGKALLIADASCEKKVLELLRKHAYGRNAETIGEITKDNVNMVRLKTRYGVTRMVDMLSGEPMPRIC